MALAKSFRETVRARAQRDPKFRLALIREAVEKLVNGDVESGLSILGDYVNATVGYKTLAERTSKNPKSLMRMLGVCHKNRATIKPTTAMPAKA